MPFGRASRAVSADRWSMSTTAVNGWRSSRSSWRVGDRRSSPLNGDPPTLGGTIVTDSADTEDRREDRIPIDLNQPIVLEVHNPDGAVTVRATERTDVLIRQATTGYGGDLGDEKIDLKIDAHQNRIEVRVSSGAGSGWAGI